MNNLIMFTLMLTFQTTGLVQGDTGLFYTMEDCQKFSSMQDSYYRLLLEDHPQGRVKVLKDKRGILYYDVLIKEASICEDTGIKADNYNPEVK